MKLSCAWAVVVGVGLRLWAPAQVPPPAVSPDSPRWRNGPSQDAAYFPIGVWLQDPRNAARFKAAGINLYVGLWAGPTLDQLAALRQVGMPVICEQNGIGLALKDDPIIIGWMHGDEPDNAQSLGPGQGYGPPIAPTAIRQDYERMRAADPTRPILLNLGQGVAWDHYIGRGIRRNHPEDYPEYLKGCDLVSFDIYPAVHEAPEVAGKLEFVGTGVERLVGWAQGQKTVWNCIECTHISNVRTQATPAQVRAEVWMSLIRGSRGLIYFVHQFKPAFREAALLDDAAMLAAVTAINRQVQELAPVLNSPTLSEGVTVSSAIADAPIAGLLKRHGGAAYLFTVNLRGRPTSGRFTILGLSAEAAVEVLGEARGLSATHGQFADEFEPYAVHLYRVAPAQLSLDPPPK